MLGSDTDQSMWWGSPGCVAKDLGRVREFGCVRYIQFKSHFKSRPLAKHVFNQCPSLDLFCPVWSFGAASNQLLRCMEFENSKNMTKALAFRNKKRCKASKARTPCASPPPLANSKSTQMANNFGILFLRDCSNAEPECC